MPKPRKKESKQDYLKRCTAELIERENRDDAQAYAMCNAMWNDDKGKRQAMTLSAPVLAAKKAEKEGEPRKFLITAYTGADLESWFGKVVIDVSGIDTMAKIPILREHMRDRVVGFSTEQWKEDHTLYLQGEFSEKTRDGKEVLALADEGFPWQASIGVWPRKVQVLADEKVQAQVNGRTIVGPAEIWTESEVKETSFVALGRDDQTAAISFAADAKDVAVEIETLTSKAKEVEQMDLKEMKKDYPELLTEIEETARKEGLDAGLKLGAESERKRVMEILAEDADPDVARKAIADGMDAGQFYKLAFQSEKAKRGQALKDMEAQAPQSAGQEMPVEKPAADTRPADVQLNEKAMVIMKAQKVDFTEALRQAFAENPALAAQWSQVRTVQ